MPLNIGDHGRVSRSHGHAEPTLTVRTEEEIHYWELHLILTIWAHDTFLASDPHGGTFNLSQKDLMGAIRDVLHEHGMKRIRDNARVGTHAATPHELICWESQEEREFCQAFADDQMARHWGAPPTAPKSNGPTIRPPQKVESNDCRDHA
jgi:hypothetical protein